MFDWRSVCGNLTTEKANINIHSLGPACIINENRAIKNYEQYVLYDFIYINNKTVTIRERETLWVRREADAEGGGHGAWVHIDFYVVTLTYMRVRQQQQQHHSRAGDEASCMYIAWNQETCAEFRRQN